MLVRRSPVHKNTEQPVSDHATSTETCDLESNRAAYSRAHTYARTHTLTHTLTHAQQFTIFSILKGQTIKMHCHKQPFNKFECGQTSRSSTMRQNPFSGFTQDTSIVEYKISTFQSFIKHLECWGFQHNLKYYNLSVPKSEFG